jgi:hypothetical protein
MNPINYAKGLLAELDAAVQNGVKDVQAEVRAELERIAPEVRQAAAELRGLAGEASASALASGEEVVSEAAAEVRAVVQRLDEVLGGSKRTAKAASAPEKAVPPAAK